MSAPRRPAPDGFTSNVLRMLAAQGLMQPLQIATGILTARFLGPHDRGLYSLLLMIPQTLELLLRLGIAPANVYVICREKATSREVVSNSVVLAFALGSLALVLVPFRNVLGATLLDHIDGGWVILAAALVPFYLLITFLTSILHAQNRFGTSNRRMIAGAALRLAATSVVLVVLQRGLFEAFLVNVGVVVLVAVWLLGTLGALRPASFRPSAALAATTVGFGVKSHIQSLLTVLHLRLDHFLVAFFLGPSDVAFYALATHIADLIGIIHSQVSVVLYPRFASTREAGVHDITLTVCRHVLVLEALAGGAILVVARFLIAFLYGPDYLPALSPLCILVPGVVMLSLFNLLSRNFMSRNRQRTPIAAGLVGLAANVALNLFLIPTLGIDGAALASTVSYSLATSVLLGAFRRQAGRSLLELVRVRRSDLEFYRNLRAGVVARSVIA